MSRALPAGLLAAVLLAGCAAPEAPSGGEPPAPGGGAPGTLTLFLTGDLGLTRDSPTGSEPEEVLNGNFFEGWGSGAGYPEFTGAPVERTLLVRNATLVLHARADGAVLQAGTFPHFVGYLGSTLPAFADRASLTASGSGNGRAAMTPGETVEVEIPLTLPRGGLLLERGASPRVLAVAVMTQDPRAADLVLLVNATGTPSRVELETTPIPDPPPLGSFEGGPPQGIVVGTAYAASVEGASKRTYAGDLPSGTVRLVAALETGTAVGFGDLDLSVLDAQGETIAESVTPTGVERVVLYPHQLEGIDRVTVVVTNYGSAAATYTLDVRAYEGAGGT